MAATSYPSPDNARALTEAQLDRIMSPLQNSGLVGTPALPALVFGNGAGRFVTVRANRQAWVWGRLWDSGSSDAPVNIPANATAAVRKDLLVLGLSRSTWNVTCYLKVGTTVLPTLQQDTGITGIYEIPLAQINAPVGSGSIASGDVVPLAWYCGQPIVLCTTTSVPAPWIGGLMMDVTTGSTYVGAPGTSAPVWKRLTTSEGGPLGTLFQVTTTPPSGPRTGPETFEAMVHTQINCLPQRYILIKARSAVLPQLAGSSADLQIVLSGGVYDKSGRIELPYITNPTGVDAEFFFRTSPTQTSMFLAINILLYPPPAVASSTFTVDATKISVSDCGAATGS